MGAKTPSLNLDKILSNFLRTHKQRDMNSSNKARTLSKNGFYVPTSSL